MSPDAQELPPRRASQRLCSVAKIPTRRTTSMAPSNRCGGGTLPSPAPTGSLPGARPLAAEHARSGRRGAGGAELPRRGAAPLRGGGCALSARLSPVSRLGWVPTCVRAEARGDCVERRSGAEGCVLGVGGRPRSPPLGTRAAARTAPGGRCCLPGAGERCLRASRLGTAGAQRSSFNSFHG